MFINKNPYDLYLVLVVGISFLGYSRTDLKLKISLQICSESNFECEINKNLLKTKESINMIITQEQIIKKDFYLPSSNIY